MTLCVKERETITHISMECVCIAAAQAKKNEAVKEHRWPVAWRVSVGIASKSAFPRSACARHTPGSSIKALAPLTAAFSSSAALATNASAPSYAIHTCSSAFHLTAQVFFDSFESL